MWPHLPGHRLLCQSCTLQGGEDTDVLLPDLGALGTAGDSSA